MNYRTVYNQERVLTSIVNDDNTVTSSNEQFIIDTIDNSINRLASWGVDISYFWKNGLAERITPERNEVEISNHPDNDAIKRKAFVWFTTNRYKTQTVFNVIVRHFNEEGEHITEPDDAFVSRVLDNSNTVDDGSGNQVPEYDFMFSLVENKIYSIFELEEARLSILDSEGLFNDIY